jgi:hypothetical protein
MPFPCAARLGKTQQRKVKVKVKATQKNESKKPSRTLFGKAFGCGTRIRTLGMTESESVALPLGDAALLTNGRYYSRFLCVCQGFFEKNRALSASRRKTFSETTRARPDAFTHSA